VSVVHVLADEADHAVRVDYDRSRVRQLRVLGVDDAPRTDRRQILVGQERKSDPLLLGVLREVVRRVRADRPDLGAARGELLQVGLQLAELRTTEGSPEAAIEDQDDGPVEPGQ
jgi:hypothetical protein